MKTRIRGVALMCSLGTGLACTIAATFAAFSGQILMAVLLIGVASLIYGQVAHREEK